MKRSQGILIGGRIWVCGEVLLVRNTAASAAKRLNDYVARNTHLCPVAIAVMGNQHRGLDIVGDREERLPRIGGKDVIASGGDGHVLKNDRVF